MRSLGTFIRALINLTAALYTFALGCLLLLRLLERDHRWWVAFLINFLPLYFLPLFLLLLTALLVRARVAFFTTLPMFILGLLLYGPWFLPKQNTAVGENRLRVISFNVSEDNPDPDRIFAWLEAQRADLVLLQEVDATWFARFERDLGDLYPHQVQVPTEQGERGNLVLTRFPVLSVPPLEEQPDSFRAVVLDVYGTPTTVYNISLFAPVEGEPRRAFPINYRFIDLAVSYDDQGRNAQIHRLLADIAAEPHAVLVAGDFNTSDQASIYSALAAEMKDSFREAGSGLGATWPVMHTRGLSRFIPPLVRLDYIWHSAHFRALQAETGPNLGSDHLPVLSTLSALPPETMNNAKISG